MSYEPQPGSVAARAVAHYRANPGASLRTAELGKVLGINPSTVAALVATPLTHGLLKRVGGEDGIRYIGGPKLFGAAPKAPPPASAAAAPAMTTADEETENRLEAAIAAPPTATANAPAVSAAKPAIVIDKGVPIPDSPSKCVLADTFAAMSIGDSFELPKQEVRAAVSSANSWGKRRGMKFISRNTGPTTGRIWRQA